LLRIDSATSIEDSHRWAPLYFTAALNDTECDEFTVGVSGYFQ
jgi:hypothetical protein